MLAKISPYIGPRPYAREDAALFFGRDREAEELFSKIVAHPVVLLYAPSGAGKTSLLNARIIPMLEKRQAQVFGAARVKGALPPDIALSGEKPNLFVYNALMSIGALRSGAVPVTLREALVSIDYPDLPDGFSSRRVMIFDQFEEIFMAREHWNQREEFFEDLGATLEEDSRFRVVLSIREEYVASLDPYAYQLPEMLETRFRLEPLRRGSALLAVTRPLEGTGFSFKEGAAEKLVNNLLLIRAPGSLAKGIGEFVEPVQLQVVCEDLWASLPEGETEITEEYIQDYGDVDQALGRYYDSCLRTVAEEKEISERKLRRWFERVLITPEGTRSIVPRGVMTTRGLHNTIVEKLEDLHLVRAEVRGGQIWYELAHDRFIDPIRHSGQHWRQDETRQDAPLQIGDFLEEVKDFVADLEGKVQGASAENETWLRDVALRWRITFSPVLNLPKSIRLLPFAEAMGNASETMSGAELHEWLNKSAYWHSMIRRINSSIGKPINFVLSERNDQRGGAEQDWFTAGVMLASEVLDGRLPLRRLGPDCYWILENEWLAEVKRIKAYLLWEDRANPYDWNHHEDDYYAVCRGLREKLIDSQVQCLPEDFLPFESYLRAHYLNADDRFDLNAESSEKLLRRKAHRIWEMTSRDTSDANWDHATDYVRMFYDNILPAVKDKDEESTLMVLKAFQFSRAPENRYLIINCFEAALAIYFLDPNVVSDLWKDAARHPAQNSYTVCSVTARGLPPGWAPPQELEDRLVIDSHDERLVLRGILKEAEKEILLRHVPSEYTEEVTSLFEQSRLLPERTTL